MVDNVLQAFKGVNFTLQEAYERNPDVSPETIQDRIYKKLGMEFKRLEKTLYITEEKSCCLIEGNGRNLFILNDKTVECIITDHPWKDGFSNCGGNRNFAPYECFEYTINDFYEKFRVLKPGCFLCEILPEESASNFEYLFRIKKLAQEAGFEYYSKVPWKMGGFVRNIGRKAKNSMDILLLSKGRARAMRPDKQRGINEYGNPSRFMSGTTEMLPTEIYAHAVPAGHRICASEKPCQLFEQLLKYVTREGELVLDQFAGGGAIGAACIKTGRGCIMIEKSKEQVNRVAKRFEMVKLT